MYILSNKSFWTTGCISAKFQSTITDHLTRNPNLKPLNIAMIIVNCNNNKEINFTNKKLYKLNIHLKLALHDI